MRRLDTLFVLVLIPVVAFADGVEPPSASTLEIEVVCEVASPSLVAVEVVVADDFDDRVQGVRVERSVLGACSTTEPFVTRQFGVLATGVHRFEWTDAVAAPGVAHRYRVVGLDAAGDDLSDWAVSFELVSPIDYGTCGDVTIGIGSISSDLAPALFQPCPDSCWDLLTLSVDAVTEPYLDTGTIVAITGSIDCALGNVEGCTIVADSAVPAQCGPVSASDRSWGAVKARF